MIWGLSGALFVVHDNGLTASVSVIKQSEAHWPIVFQFLEACIKYLERVWPYRLEKSLVLRGNSFRDITFELE